MSTDKLRDLEREIAAKLDRIHHLDAEVDRLKAAVEEERKLLRLLMDEEFDDVEVTEEDVAEVRREMEEAGEIPVIPPEQRID